MAKKKEKCWEAVFTGDSLEADLVANMLQAEGFNAMIKSDAPRSYVGPAGMSRVMVPGRSLAKAKELLDSLQA